MKNKQQIRVNNQFNFVLSQNDLDDLDILILKKDKKHVLLKNASHSIVISKRDFKLKAYEINIDSEVYNVVIKNELDTRIKKMGFSIEKTAISKSFKAPMPGFILDILVKKGAHVQKGSPILILEAMKMENTINAPMEGRIKSIHVTKGENVEKGTLLIEME